MSRKKFTIAVAIVALCGSNMLPTSATGSYPRAGVQRSTVARLNTFDLRSQTTSAMPASRATSVVAATASVQPNQLLHTAPLPMQPAVVWLDPNNDTRFVGSDGRLELIAPAGAISAADAAAAGGRVGLMIRQIAPSSGSTAGGSGHVSFGTFLVQVVDSTSHLRSAGLRKALTVELHYGARDRAFDLSHAFAVINGSIPAGTVLNPDPTGAAMSAATAGLGAATSQPLTLDTSQQTLTASPLASTPSTTWSFNSDAPVASFGKPDPFNVDLSAGSLTAGYPIDVPRGPGGLTPPIVLGYSSAALAEQHNVQAAAPWVGEGWNLSLGSISWAEHNATSALRTATWEDSWQLNDAYGTAAELIPPNINVTTATDDTGNPLTASPITWHTAPETHAKVISYAATSLTADPAAVSWGSGRIDVFVRGSDNALWHRWYDTAGWSNWESLGGSITSSPGAASWGSGHLDVFALGTDNAVWQKTFDSSTGGWHAWASLGGTFTSRPNAVSWGSGRIDVVARGTDQALWHKSFSAGSWQAWEDLGGGLASGPGISSWAASRLDVFAQCLDHSLCHKWYDGTSWSAWQGLGGTLASDPAAVSWGSNRIDVFIRCVDGSLCHIWYDGTSWSAWQGLGGTLSAGPGVSSWGVGRLDVFGQCLDGSVCHKWYDGTSWSIWESVSQPPLRCFRVFLPNGIMEEFGCTVDSAQYYSQPIGQNAGLIYQSGWLLDLITDPHGNQIHFTYQEDVQNANGSRQYPRDSVLATVEYDSPACRNAQTACAGTDWVPLVRVNFSASHAVAHVPAGSNPCPANGSLRCDDPIDLSGSQGLVNPMVQSTFVLNDIQVQVRGSGAASWNTLRDYQLGYDQGGPTSIVDPSTSKSESTAGRLNLTQLLQIGSDGSTALPARSFGYTTVAEFYEDALYQPNPSTNCGPSWNTGTGTGCLLWSRSYDGNGFYLSSASNGLGLQQTFTWANARNNTHGANGGGANNTNPLACTTQNTVPCNEADDQNWSHVVLTQQNGAVNTISQTGQGGNQTTAPVTSTTAYSYVLPSFTAQPCPDCTQGFYWGNQNDDDYLDYYNGKFTGFASASAVFPDSSKDVHTFYASEGWGLYDTAQVTCYTQNPCHNAPWWDLANAAHGHETEVDRYDKNGVVLRKTLSQFQAICPPAGVAGTPPSGGWGNWKGNLVSELDHNNPVAVCDVQTTRVDAVTVDGSSNAAVPDRTSAYAYDSYGRVTSETITTNDGGVTGSATTIVHKPLYVYNDAVSATSTSATGTYLIDVRAFSDSEDASGNRFSCSYTSYDGNVYTTGATSTLTLGQATRVDRYTNCGTLANGFTDKSGPLTTTHSYDSFGNLVTTNDPDANAGISSHLGCSVSGSTYSACFAYDSTFSALPTSQTNALNQTTVTGYQSPTSGTASGGFGLWPMSTTDPNSQATSYGYDGLGRLTSQTLPNESAGLTTTSLAYADWCSGTSAQTPCVEIDHIQRLNATTTVTARAFYDGWGNLVETRVPAPNNQDVVRYMLYDTSVRPVAESVAYFVAAYTGAAGSAAYSIPDSTQLPSPTMHTYDGLGRLLTTKDPLLNQTTITISVVCNAPGTGDTACYEQTLTVDPLGHQGGGLVDALGRTEYVQRYTGNSSPSYALYATAKYVYDVNGNLTRIVHPDGSTTTSWQFDTAGRTTQQTDPDKGVTTYTYDQDGNLTQSVDARGSTGTIFAGYDGVDRPLWHNTTNGPTGAYETFTYDSTAGGNQGIGRLTGEAFTGGPNNTLSGSYGYAYDGRGQQTSRTLTIGSTPYPVQASYDDAGNLLTQTYPTGEVVTTGFTAQGWLSSLSTSQGSTSLLSNAGYAQGSGQFGGPAGLLTSASLGGGTYQYSATYDALLRATDFKWTNGSGSTTFFDQARTIDAAGNVIRANSTLPAGTDNQVFCYDEQDRLTWAGSVGTPPCGLSLTPGSLTAAQYTQAFTYDNLGRPASGPLGAYSYGDAAHKHAATAIGSAWTGKYDAAGGLTCRAPTSATTCAGTPTGASLSFDAEGRLSSWQNTPSNPTTTAGFLYDNQGNRVEQQVTQGGPTTTTAYVSNLEEVTTTGSTITTTTFYYAGAMRIALAVNGTFSYLASDGLTSATVALNASGSATASLLYAPYGGGRYSSGTMPTDFGFTGQHADNATGLDYYNARYYDPLASQFTSADSILPGTGYDIWGLSRYAYVEHNPIVRTDATGNHIELGCEPYCGDPSVSSGRLPLGSPSVPCQPFCSIGGRPSTSQGDGSFNSRTCDVACSVGGIGVQPYPNETIGIPPIRPAPAGIMIGLGWIIWTALHHEAFWQPRNVGQACNEDPYGGGCTTVFHKATGSGPSAESDTTKPIEDRASPSFTDPSVPPGTDWEWRGSGEPSTGKGAWYNPRTGESLHPDLNHPDPIGPHWDYTDPQGQGYRWYPDGKVVPKA